MRRQQGWRWSGVLQACRPCPSGQLAAARVALVAFGAVSLFTSGFVFRYPPADRQLATLDVGKSGFYVRKRFREFEDKPFADNGMPKVLVIGDSFAQDFVNVLDEAGLRDRLDLSTFFIEVNCGNLLLKQDISALIPDAGQRQRCAGTARYEDPALRERIAKADMIFLASQWLPWQAPLVPESVANIESLTGAKVVVVGRKNFGRIRMRDYLQVPADRRDAIRNVIPEQYVAVGDEMASAIDPADYIDFMKLLCESGGKCPVFTPDGKLMSADGAHLTRAGVAYVAALVKKTPPIADLLRRAGVTG